MNSSLPVQSGTQHALTASPWVMRFGERIPPGESVLDVACGDGRHTCWFAERGNLVHAVDREPLTKLLPRIAFKQADIERDTWPYAGQYFGGVVVTNYLHRPLFTYLIEAIKPGGWLIYETFAEGNEKYGKPSRPDFLLRPGELLGVVNGKLQVAAYEHGEVTSPKPAVIQRIAAWRVSE